MALIIAYMEAKNESISCSRDSSSLLGRQNST